MVTAAFRGGGVVVPLDRTLSGLNQESSLSLIVTLGHTYLLLRSCSVRAFWNKLPLFLALGWVPRRLSGSAGGFTGTG